MSGVAVASAVVAIGTAVATGFETFAIIAAVGATIGAVGTVAKIPELQIAGAVIGGVGAIGGLASAAGLFSDFGSIFGAGESVLAADAAFSGASGAFDAVGGAGPAFLGGGESLGAAAGGFDAAGPSIGDIIDGVTGQMSGVGAGDTSLGSSFAQAPDVMPSAVVDSAPVKVTGTEGVDALTNIDSNTVLQGSEGTSPQVAEAAPKPPNAPSVTGVTDPVVKPGDITGIINSPSSANTPGFNKLPGMDVPGEPSIFEKLLGFTKTPGGGLLMQGGMSFIGGLFDTEKPAKVEAWKAQAQANAAQANKFNADASLTQMQVANMSQPLPSARRTGLINTPQLAPVTGAPA